MGAYSPTPRPYVLAQDQPHDRVKNQRQQRERPAQQKEDEPEKELYQLFLLNVRLSESRSERRLNLHPDLLILGHITRIKDAILSRVPI